MQKALFLTIMLLAILAITATAFSEDCSFPDRSIIFEEKSYVVYVGKLQKINASVETILDTAPKQTQLVWTSSDPDVLTVNASGQVRGEKPGKAVIFATAKDNEIISSSVEVEVRVPVQSVQINEKNLTVAVDGKEENARAQLTVTIMPENAFFQSGVWSSSNESVASVDQNGLVTGHSNGNASIMFVSDDPNGIKKTQTTVRVGRYVTSIILSNSESVRVKRSLMLKPEVFPKEATNKRLEFESSNSEIATVSSSGLVTGASSGEAMITCRATDGSGVSASCRVRVYQPVTKFEVTDRQIELAPDTTWKQNVIILPDDATDKSIIWTSTDEKVADVDAEGVIHGVSAGDCVITGTCQDESGIKALVNVRVRDYEVIIRTSDPVYTDFTTESWESTTRYLFDDVRFKARVKIKNGCVKPYGVYNYMLLPVKTGSDEVSVKVTRNRTVIKNEKHTVYVAQSALEKKSGTKKKEVVLPGVIEAKNKKQFNGEWFLRKVKIDGEAFNADDFREHILMGEISVKVENLATFERRSKNSVYSMGYEIIGCYDGSLKLDNFAGDKLYMWPTSDGGIYCKINLKEVFQLINLDVGMYFYKQEQISSEQ